MSCKGGTFDLVKIPYVTLIDTLDTLVVLGDIAEFRRVVDLLYFQLESFNFDVNVSLFETTIRVLGGLLSAHLLAGEAPPRYSWEVDHRDRSRPQDLFTSPLPSMTCDMYWWRIDPYDPHR